MDISAIENNSIMRNHLDLSLQSQTMTKNRARMQYLNKSGFNEHEQSVYERLQQQASIYQTIRKEKQNRVEAPQNIDPVTGQELFKPQINRKPSLVTGRRNQPSQVGSQLHKKHKMTLAKRELKKAEEVDKLNEARKLISKPNDKSDRIVNNLRKQKLAEIFDRMDGDRDGEISHGKIDWGVLSSELQIAFKPLLQELE